MGALLGAKDAPSETYRVVVEGEMIAAVLRRSGGAAEMAWRFPNLHVTIEGAAALANSADRIAADLGRPVFGAVTPQGRISGVRFESSVNPASKTFARALLGITQFVFSDKPGATEWDTTEDDPAGTYTAHYQSAAGGFRKIKTAYSGPVSRGVSPVYAFHASFDFGKGRLQSIEGVEEQEVFQSGHLIAHGVNTVELKHEADGRVPSAELSALLRAASDLERVAASPLSAGPSAEERRRSVAEATLGGSTAEELAAEVEALAAAPRLSGQNPQLYLKVRSLLYLHPEACARLGTMLAAAPAGSPVLRLLTEAFASAGTPEAQHVLTFVMQSRSGDPAVFSTLAFALARTAAPAQEAEDALKDAAFRDPESDAGRAAQLALGAAARQIASTDPKRGMALVEQLIRRFEAMPTPGAAKRLLSVLGNAGSVRALPVIVKYLNAPSADMRGAAASALRFVQGAEADRLLAAAAGDHEPSVRLAALSAMSYRAIQPATLAADKEALLADAEESVRLAALHNLWQAKDASSDALALVRQAAGEGQPEHVRKAAAELLGAQ
jgi:hypothetical protein